MDPHISSHRAPCSCFPKKVSLQLSSEQSVGDVRITQLDWNRVPQARSRGCKSTTMNESVCFVYVSVFLSVRVHNSKSARPNSTKSFPHMLTVSAARSSLQTQRAKYFRSSVADGPARRAASRHRAVNTGRRSV